MEYPLTQATVETLSNGLTVILDPDSTAPVVSAQIWVETGSIHEDQHLGAGISHFLEHMVFKGTRDYGSEALADTVQAAGGHWNAYTTFDRTVYYIDGPSASISVFLKCLTGLVFFPNLPEAEFEKEKDVIRREIDMGLDDPDHAATRLLLSSVFQIDPRRHPVIGHRHRFDAIRYEDLTGYHRDRYTTDRSFIVISGDFDPDDVRKSIISLTDGCLPGCGREPFVAADPPQLGPRNARETFAIPNSRIALAWKSPAIDHPDAPAFDLLATMLGSGQSSRLHRSLRDEAGLALEISSFSWSGPGREGVFAISADVSPELREPLIEGIHGQILLLQTEALASDIAKAKRQVATSQFKSLTSASGRATDLGMNWHQARDLDFTRSHVRAIQRVTEDEIRRVAGRLVKERLTLSILDPIDAPVPLSGGKRKREQESIEVHTLGNGLQVALIPDHRVPLVYVQAAVRSGLPSETVENQGLNQLLASVLPKGTTTRSAQEIALSLESLGASCSAGTGNNVMLVQAGGLAPDLATILEVFSEILIAPSFADDVIVREKASQIAACEESRQDPLHVCFSALRSAVFGADGYGLDALGSPESLMALGREDLVSQHRRHFNTANITLAIAGDFVASEVLESLSGHLSAMPTGDRWLVPATTIHLGGDVTARLPKKQAVLTIGFPGTSVSGADRYALAMIQEYATDMAGPLFNRIREELGLAYRVGATQFLGFDAGLFTYYLATSPEQVDLARTELLDEIAKIAAHGIPDDVFERVRSTVLSGLAIQQQSPSQTARQVALDLLFGHPPDQCRRLTGIYQLITADDVRAVAKRIFSVKPTLATVLPE